jgi:hypothetical protein
MYKSKGGGRMSISTEPSRLSIASQAKPPRRRFPADAAKLVRHCRWQAAAGRSLIALAIARTALEFHLRVLAAGRVKCRDRYPLAIAEGLRNVGILSDTEVHTAGYLFRNLSRAVHQAECRYSPDSLVETLSGFIRATKDRATINGADRQ